MADEDVTMNAADTSLTPKATQQAGTGDQESNSRSPTPGPSTGKRKNRHRSSSPPSHNLNSGDEGNVSAGREDIQGRGGRKKPRLYTGPLSRRVPKPTRANDWHMKRDEVPDDALKTKVRDW